MPRGIPNKEIDSRNEVVAQQKSVNIPTTGSLENLLRPDHEVEIYRDGNIDDYAQELAFGEEIVDVVVHESTDKNAEPIVDVYCNGTPQRFIRGMQQKVKRKFVGILAQARQTSISTKVSAMGENGEPVNRIDKHSAVRYPFSVVYDANPRGAAWLRNLLASS